MNAAECKPFPLVTTDNCEIWRCSDCGAVHINLGAVSLRLKEKHFKSVGEAVQTAVEKLEQIKAMSGEGDGILRPGMKPD